MLMFKSVLPWSFTSKDEPTVDKTKRTSDDLARDTLELLRHFEGADYTLPPSARVRPSIKQRQRQNLGFFDFWRYVVFVIGKTFAVFFAFLTHYMWGPRKKSWGWEMTFVTSIMQNVGDHSHLTDVPTLRRLINMVGYAPLPSDAMVTPVSFPVRRRKLRGILSEVDHREDGKRELSGEWVVGRKLWKKLQAEWKATRSSVDSKPSPPDKAPRRKDRVILYLHGGAYYMFSAATHRQLTIQLAKYTESRLFAVDYRLAPEVRFPGQIHDAVSAYMRLLDLRIPPENILLAGDSAGGALCLALLMYLRDNEYPSPAGAILMSPWVDLTMSCDSWDTNAAYDIIPPPKPGDHLNPISCYLGEDVEKLVAHPYASPLFGDLRGLPPLLIQAGDSEVLRDEITLLAHKARLAGVQVWYELYEDAVHVFQQFPFLETSTRAYQACRDFVMNDLPILQRRSPRYLEQTTQDELREQTANKRTRQVKANGSAMTEERLEMSPHGANHANSVSSDSKAAEHATKINGGPPKTVEERPAELSAKRSWTSSLHRRFAFTPVREEEGDVTPKEAATPKEEASPRTRNHHRHATGLQSPTFLTPTPAPSIRTRNRALSHPDISSLCQQWASSSPSDRSLTYVSASGPNNIRP